MAAPTNHTTQRSAATAQEAYTMATPTTSGQVNAAVKAALAQGNPIGTNLATPNQLAQAVCGSGITALHAYGQAVRGNMRAAGYRANPQWPAIGYKAWCAVYGVQAVLSNPQATAQAHSKAVASVGNALTVGGTLAAKPVTAAAQAHANHQAALKAQAAARQAAAASKRAAQAAPAPQATPQAN